MRALAKLTLLVSISAKRAGSGNSGRSISKKDFAIRRPKRVRDGPEQTDRFLWDYRRTIAALLTDAHYGAIKAVAQERGLKLYGESALGSAPRARR